MNSLTEAHSLESCLNDVRAARGTLKRFDEDFLAPALARYIFDKTKDPTFHPGARQALLPWLIEAATQRPDQSLNDLIKSMDPERVGGQSFTFRAGPEGTIRHRADARTRLIIGGPACHDALVTLGDVVREARRLQAAMAQFAESFALHAAFTSLTQQWARVDLAAFPGAETYEGTWTVSGVAAQVRHPMYSLRLLTEARFPQVCQACQELSAKLCSGGLGCSLSSQDRIATAPPGSTYVFPSNRKVHSPIFFADAVYELLCVLNPKISHTYHMNSVKRSAPWHAALPPHTAAEDAVPTSVLNWGSIARRAASAACDHARGVMALQYGEARAERAGATFQRECQTFNSGTWEGWRARVIKVVRGGDDPRAAELAHDLALFVDAFYGEFLAVLPKLCNEEERSDE